MEAEKENGSWKEKGVGWQRIKGEAIEARGKWKNRIAWGDRADEQAESK